MSGTYKGILGEAPVAGTLQGNVLKLTFKVSGVMGELDVEYAGTVKLGPETGSFTGKRA